MNKIWTILDGFRDVPVFGDYRRLTELSGLYFSDDTKSLVLSIFNEIDPNKKGYIVESVLQAALLSNYRDRLLEFDPINTYDIPIDTIRRKNKVVSEHNTASLTVSSNANPVYKSEGSIERYENNVLVTVNNKTFFTELKPDIKVTPNATIQFPSINKVENAAFEIYSLPEEPPLVIFLNQLKKNLPAIANNKDVITAAGEFVYTLIHK